MVAHTYTFSVVLEDDEESGGFVVHVPALPGCHTQGETREEAIEMARDAVAGYLESLLSHNEPIPIEANPTGPVRVTATVKADVHAEATAA